MTVTPSYSFLDQSDWTARITLARELARNCKLCPRSCGVNRFDGERGFCGASGQVRISSAFPHHGEEPPIAGTAGSGTVFFSHCTLNCVFCQNHQISHEGVGNHLDTGRLAATFLDLQAQGCHNINLVTAGHYLPWVLEALREAACQGLAVPIVYNCGGYESGDALALLDGVIDLYLPDMKYGGSEEAARFSGAADYCSVNQQAIRTMFRQVGPFRTDATGIATRGLCIRHLVLPGGLSRSEEIAHWLARTFDPADITISLMAQYRPLYRAGEFAELAQPVDHGEYEKVHALFADLGFEGFYQEPQQLNTSYVIDFTARKSQRLIDPDESCASILPKQNQ